MRDSDVGYAVDALLHRNFAHRGNRNEDMEVMRHAASALLRRDFPLRGNRNEVVEVIGHAASALLRRIDVPQAGDIGGVEEIGALVSLWGMEVLVVKHSDNE